MSNPAPLRKPFIPEILDRSTIVIPLLRKFHEEEESLRERNPRPSSLLYPVIVVMNGKYHDGSLYGARRWAEMQLAEILAGRGKDKSRANQGLVFKGGFTDAYLFGNFEASVIRQLVQRSRESVRKKSQSSPSQQAITQIWPDFTIRAYNHSASEAADRETVRGSVPSLGAGITWAVIDSGIDSKHPHFSRYENLNVEPPLRHLDFTESQAPFHDGNGHGTYIAGIMAGGLDSSGTKKGRVNKLRAVVRERDEDGNAVYLKQSREYISGLAPSCKLLSLKVLDELGFGSVSSLIAAIGYIRQLNSDAGEPLVQGITISVGYEADPEWQAAGPSPLQIEVNRLVNTGAVVVVADGNPVLARSGYYDGYRGDTEVESAIPIHEPGNAEQVISVASTFRGISLDSKRPLFSPNKLQNDEKPDIIAPIINMMSCATGRAHARIKEYLDTDFGYAEDSGTCVNAAWVSGSIAAFLSVRKEFVGQPEKVKRLFTSAEGIKLLNSELTKEAIAQLGNQFKRTKVFISYSHEDKSWLERLRVHLGPLQREGILDFWDDTRIRTGEKWKDKITEALKSARVAVLLVSADFLNSDFIQSNELPELLSGAENEGVIIMSMIIKPSLFKRAKNISQFQSVNPPDKPLINLSEGEQEAYWLKLAEDIERVFEEYSPDGPTST